MDNKVIACKIDFGLGMQHVYFYENDVLKDEESVALTDLPSYLVHTCQSENCSNIHIFGPGNYLFGLIRLIKNEEIIKYNSNTLNIEVN